jgi:hypothetical protein
MDHEMKAKESTGQSRFPVLMVLQALDFAVSARRGSE